MTGFGRLVSGRSMAFSNMLSWREGKKIQDESSGNDTDSRLLDFCDMRANIRTDKPAILFCS